MPSELTLRPLFLGSVTVIPTASGEESPGVVRKPGATVKSK